MDERLRTTETFLGNPMKPFFTSVSLGKIVGEPTSRELPAKETELHSPAATMQMANNPFLLTSAPLVRLIHKAGNVAAPARPWA